MGDQQGICNINRRPVCVGGLGWHTWQSAPHIADVLLCGWHFTHVSLVPSTGRTTESQRCQQPRSHVHIITMFLFDLLSRSLPLVYSFDKRTNGVSNDMCRIRHGWGQDMYNLSISHTQRYSFVSVYVCVCGCVSLKLWKSSKQSRHCNCNQDLFLLLCQFGSAFKCVSECVCLCVY